MQCSSLRNLEARADGQSHPCRYSAGARSSLQALIDDTSDATSFVDAFRKQPLQQVGTGSSAKLRHGSTLKDPCHKQSLQEASIVLAPSAGQMNAEHTLRAARATRDKSEGNRATGTCSVGISIADLLLQK